MPELPEVETMCRGLYPMVGRTILSAHCPKIDVKSIRYQPEKEKLLRKLKGSEIVRIDRRGKRVVIELTCGNLVFQPKMTGLVCLTDPPDPGHTRLILKMESSMDRFGSGRNDPNCADHVYFWDRRGLGTISLWNAEELEQHLGPAVLGPDALLISVDDLRRRASKSKRAIKVLLLDQKVVAGVGNLYASEILHKIGLDPTVTADRINSRQ